MINEFLNYINSFSFAIADFHGIVVYFGFFILLFTGAVVSALTNIESLFPAFLFAWLGLSGLMIYGEINYRHLNSSLVSENLSFNNQGTLYEMINDSMIEGLVVKNEKKAIGRIECSLSWQECADLIIKNKSKMISSNSQPNINSTIVLNK